MGGGGVSVPSLSPHLLIYDPLPQTQLLALDSISVKGSHALPSSHWIMLPLKQLSELCLNLTLCQTEGPSLRVV